jgi:hypothetical protein
VVNEMYNPTFRVGDKVAYIDDSGQEKQGEIFFVYGNGFLEVKSGRQVELIREEALQRH